VKKRIISCLFALALMMSFGTATAFASETSPSLITPNSAQASFNFSLLRGANSSSTSAAYKNDTTSADVYPQSGYMYTGDSIAFRVRDSNRNEATGLYSRTDFSSFNMWYNTGSGLPGYYYLYADAPSNNYSQYVTMAGVWYP